MIEPSYATRRRHSRWALPAALAVAFLLGVALSGYAVRRSDRVAAWLHPVTPPAPVRIAVPVRVAVPVAAAPDESALAARVDAVEGRLDEADARAATVTGDADRADGLLVAFAARRALDRGAPLGFLEGMLRDRFGATQAPAVATVIAAGQRPVTLAQLQDGLAALAPTLATTAPDAGWWSATKAELGNLFVVHRADVPSALPADRLARARHALEEGQVDAASAEVSRLAGASRASDWLAAARRYSLAHQALDRLETAALLRPRLDAPAIATAG